MIISNSEEMPDDLEPGEYCCQIDELSTLADIRIRVIMPLRKHVPGDCLIQIIKHPYKYLPAQEEMADAVGWLATEEGHAWLNKKCSDDNLGLSKQSWISIKTPEEYEMVWFPPIYRTQEEEKELAAAANGGRWICYLPIDQVGWLKVDELRSKAEEFYRDPAPVQENCLV